MKNIFKIGDQKTYVKTILPEDIAKFESGVVHEVCSTFSLAQAAEWSSRLFVIDMKEEHEEGIGTMLTIEHKSPALIGDEVVITATIESQKKNDLICSYIAKVDERVVAIGKTGQKILLKEKIDALFTGLKTNG